VIDVKTEKIVPFQKAGRKFPENRHVSTIHRYRLRGVRGIKLETILIGGIRYTSEEAIQRFIDSLNSAGSPAPAISPAQRQRQSEAARVALQEMGI